MPELPEVETIMLGITPLLEGATITKVKFRRYYAKVTDKTTGKKKSKAKSMPLAVCKVILSLDPS
ncbi:MAG: DNA-formamidopyrimidine glycosylase family protein, partial [Paracoccaceae bacterium]